MSLSTVIVATTFVLLPEQSPVIVQVGVLVKLVPAKVLVPLVQASAAVDVGSDATRAASRAAAWVASCR